MIGKKTAYLFIIIHEAKHIIDKTRFSIDQTNLLLILQDKNYSWINYKMKLKHNENTRVLANCQSL